MHPQLPAQVNQQQQQPQNMILSLPQIQNGRDLFQRLCQQQERVYQEFDRQNDQQMNTSINELQLWVDIGGPHHQLTISMARVFLESLKTLRSQKQARDQNLWHEYCICALLAFITALVLYIVDQLTKPSGQHSNLWIGSVIIAGLWTIIQVIRYLKISFKQKKTRPLKSE